MMMSGVTVVILFKFDLHWCCK